MSRRAALLQLLSYGLPVMLVLCVAVAADTQPTTAALEERVMVEINFDLALNQESDNGYTASHAVAEYLGDEALLWMRYFHTLASGTPGNAPMRVALMEFKNHSAWADFEERNMRASAVLYDLFWINWKRVIWETTDEDPDTAPVSRDREPESPAGYVFAFRYSVKEGKETAFKALQGRYAADIKTDAEAAPGFLEKRTFAAGDFQSTYTNLELWEFNSMKALATFISKGSPYGRFRAEARPLLAEFATSLYIPGGQGGRILAGQGAVMLSQSQQQPTEGQAADGQATADTEKQNQ